MARTERYLEGLTIHKVPFNVTNTPAFKEAVNNAADNELFIITDTPTFSLKIGSVTYDGTSNVSVTPKDLGLKKLTIGDKEYNGTNDINIIVATNSISGLMSAADKTKLDGIATGANKTTVDSSLSASSTNPVQNKVIKSALDGKLSTSGGTLTGNLNGQYITGTWLQTTQATDLGRTPGKIAILDDSGWIYYRTPAELKSDIGVNGYLPTTGGTMTGAITTKGIKLTSGTDFGSSLPSSLQSNQLFFQTLGSNYILDNVYPVGSIYMSVNSTNPKNLFGGTWEQIQGRFLFGMNSSYPAGSTGGEITHKLTQGEMPKHNHIIYAPNAGGPDEGAALGFPEVGSPNTWWAAACMTEQTGDNEAHNNMPPYLSVYIWKRTK